MVSMALARIHSRPTHPASLRLLGRPNAPGRRRGVESFPTFKKSAHLSPAPSPPPAGTFHAKLTIGEPNDRFEQEADQIASEVMRTPVTGANPDPGEAAGADRPRSSIVRRACCDSCTSGAACRDEQLTIRRFSVRAEGLAPPLPKVAVPAIGPPVESHIRSLRGAGPLSPHPSGPSSSPDSASTSPVSAFTSAPRRRSPPAPSARGPIRWAGTSCSHRESTRPDPLGAGNCWPMS